MRIPPTLLAVLAVVLWGCSAPKEPIAASAVQDPAQELYDKIDALTLPVPDETKRDDEEYKAVFMAEYKTAVMERGELILELCEKYPASRRTAALFDSHWKNIIKTDFEDSDLELYFRDIDDVITDSAPEELKRLGEYWTVLLSAFLDNEDPMAILLNAERYSNAYPKDPSGVVLFKFAAVAKGATVEVYNKAMNAIIDKYPGATDDVTMARAILPLLKYVGTEFEMEFEDAIDQRKVTMASLRGKVVVIDFWATWCIPCIQALPGLKQVYAKYKDEGVEFIGISLDDEIARGGLASLVSFVEQNKVPWPQYYVGEEPEFPAKYGVNTLPTMFILDKQGVIRSVDGYSVLRRTLDELLAE